MKMKTTGMKKFLAVALAVAMTMSLAPVAAVAVGTVEVNGTSTTLASAVSSATDGDTIKLVSDADISASGLTVDKAITLDLNGCTLTAANTDTGNIDVTGSLTLQDTSAGAYGQIVSNTAYTGGATSFCVIQAINGGTFTMNSGNISTAQNDPANKGNFAVGVLGQGSTVTINGGTITAGWYAISGNGSTGRGGTTVNINGGTLTSTADYAVYHPQVGTLNIRGGTITGLAGGVAMNAGTLNMTGGTIISSGTGSTGNWSDGTGGLSNSAVSLNAKYSAVTAAFSGGTLSASGNAIAVNANTNSTVSSVANTTFVATTAESLANAVAMAAKGTGNTVKLGADIALTAALAVENSAFTLDLNGKTLDTGTYGIVVTAAGALTVTGKGTVKTTAAGTGGAAGVCYPIFNVAAGCSLNIENGTYQTASYQLITAQGTVNIANGTFTDTASDTSTYDSKAMFVVIGRAAHLTMTAGTVTVGTNSIASDGMYGIYARDGASVTMGDESTHNGPSVTSLFAPLGANNTTATSSFTVYGGTYTSTAAPNGAWWKIYCAGVYFADDGSLNISGGTFNGYYGISIPYKNTASAVSISGGTFTAASGNPVFYIGDGNGSYGTGAKTIAISGGSFSSDVSAYTADGYTQATDKSVGTYAASVGTTTYTTVSAAIADAYGGTVVLRGNVSEDVVVPAGTTATLDLNGFTLTGATAASAKALSLDYSEPFIQATVTNNGTLTIVDTSTNKTGTIKSIGKYNAALFNKTGATATLNGGTFTDYDNAGGYWYIVVNLGTMTINDGVTIANQNPAKTSDTALINGVDQQLVKGQSITGYTVASDAVLTINGGTFTSGLFVVKNGDWYATATINGGTFTSKNGSNVGVVLSNSNNCPMTVNGGTFAVATGATPVVKCKDKTEYVGHAAASGLTITGGTFTAADAGDAIQTLTKTGIQVPVLTIKGGTFTGTVNAATEASNSGSSYQVAASGLAITGGAYSANVTGLVDTNTYAVTYGTMYVVAPKPAVAVNNVVTTPVATPVNITNAISSVAGGTETSTLTVKATTDVGGEATTEVTAAFDANAAKAIAANTTENSAAVLTVTNVTDTATKNAYGTDSTVVALNLTDAATGDKIAFNTTENPGSVTVTVPADTSKGYVNIYYIDANGNLSTDGISNVIVGDGVVTFTTTHFTDYVTVPSANPNSYTVTISATDPDVFYGSDTITYTVALTNSNAGSTDLIGAFDLAIKYDSTNLSYYDSDHANNTSVAVSAADSVVHIFRNGTEPIANSTGGITVCTLTFTAKTHTETGADIAIGAFSLSPDKIGSVTPNYVANTTQAADAAVVALTDNTTSDVIKTAMVSFNSNTTDTVTNMPADGAQWVKYNVATDISTLTNKTPARTGYTFAGWNTDAGATTALTSVTATAATTTLYAVWTPIQYTLTPASFTGGTIAYTVNGATVTTATVGQTVTATLTLDPGKTVSTVTAADQSGNPVTLTPVENESYTYTFKMPASPVTLTAAASDVTYTVRTLVADANTAVTEPQATVTDLATSSTYQAADLTFTVAPNEGYKLNSVTYTVGAGTAQTLTADNGTYTIPKSAVTGNILVTVTTGVDISISDWAALTASGNAWTAYSAYTGNDQYLVLTCAGAADLAFNSTIASTITGGIYQDGTSYYALVDLAAAGLTAGAAKAQVIAYLQSVLTVTAANAANDISMSGDYDVNLSGLFNLVDAQNVYAFNAGITFAGGYIASDKVLILANKDSEDSAASIATDDITAFVSHYHLLAYGS